MYKLVKTFLESKLAVYIQSLKNDHIFPPENSTSRNMSHGSHQMHCRGFIKKDITLLLIVRKKKKARACSLMDHATIIPILQKTVSVRLHNFHKETK